MGAIRTLRNPTTLFALAALTIVALCVAITRTHAFAMNPDVGAWGVTFDLTLTVPIVYWLLVVRPGRARPLTIAPVFVVGMLVAALVVPRGQQDFLHQLRYISAPLEVVTLVLVGSRIARGRNIADATRAVLGDTKVAAFVAAEVTILWYALFCWTRKAERPPRSFTVHERSGWGSIVACILVLLGAESVGLHLLLQLWSRTAAWVATALDVYGVLWVLGDYHALRLRASTVDDGVLHLRYGMRWTASIPLSNIAAVETVSSEEEWKRKGVLKVAMLDAPRFLIRLREPAVVQGIAGITKTVDAIAILPDDEEAFRAALSS